MRFIVLSRPYVSTSALLFLATYMQVKTNKSYVKLSLTSNIGTIHTVY